MSKAIGVEASNENAQVFKTLDRLRQKSQIAIRSNWFDLGRDLKNEANKEIKRRPKSGITYFIRMKGGRYKRHVASAPGETHANLTGRLRRSVSWKVHGFARMVFGYGFATTAGNKAPEYDTFVEDGTKNAKPRPSIGNAVKAIRRTATVGFRQQIMKEFKRTK